MGKELLIVRVWRHKIPATAGVGAIAVILLWPAIPLRGLGTWFQTLTGLFPTNILYPFFAILVGSFVALYTYNRKICRLCSAKEARKGSAATAFGVLFGACPACIPALAFFLPLSITVTLGYLSWIFLLVAIALLLFSIYRMNGFKGDYH
jgi:hypothetical protein